MTSGLVNASLSLPEWQAVKRIFFAPYAFAGLSLKFQLGSSLGSMFLLFRIKVAGPHAHSYHGKISGPWFMVTTLHLVQNQDFLVTQS